MRTLIISDVHHRLEFVKNILRNESHDRVIFTGDFLDFRMDKPTHGQPASYEEIIKFLIKSADNDHHIRIIGNHDIQYLQGFYGGYYVRSLDCGMSQICRDLFQEYFEKNPILLELIFHKASHIEDIGSQKILFTHAGLHEYWIEKEGLCTIDDCEQRIESVFGGMYKNDFLSTDNIVGAIGASRGGSSNYGSVTWRDNDDESIGNLDRFRKGRGLAPLINFHQIYGHTATDKTVVINTVNGFKQICLDSRQHCYGILEGNTLTFRAREFDGTRIKFNVNNDDELLKELQEYQINFT